VCRQRDCHLSLLATYSFAAVVAQRFWLLQEAVAQLSKDTTKVERDIGREEAALERAKVSRERQGAALAPRHSRL